MHDYYNNIFRLAVVPLFVGLHTSFVKICKMVGKNQIFTLKYGLVFEDIELIHISINIHSKFNTN